VKGRLSGIYQDAIQNQLKTAQSRGILEDKQRIERMARERADYRFRLGRTLVHDAEQCSICGVGRVEHGREVQSRGRHGMGTGTGTVEWWMAMRFLILQPSFCL
jgi:hypothetical protein